MLLLLSVWAVDKNPNEYLPFTDPIQQAVVKHRDAVRSVWTTATCEPNTASKLRVLPGSGSHLAASPLRGWQVSRTRRCLSSGRLRRWSARCR